MVSNGYCNTAKYRQIPSDTIWKPAFKKPLGNLVCPPPDSYATEILGIGYNNIEILDF